MGGSRFRQRCERVMAVGARVRVDARGVWAGTLGSRLVRWVVVAAVVLVVVLDAGSVVMTRMSLSDDGREAGRAAARAVSGLPLTAVTAVTAFEAAAEVAAQKDGVSVRESGFEVLSGGGVALTVVRTAPSLVLGRVLWLERFEVVEVSVVVEKPVM
jgi:hypothetical protein